jgi:hypothetical protein
MAGGAGGEEETNECHLENTSNVVQRHTRKMLNLSFMKIIEIVAY